MQLKKQLLEWYNQQLQQKNIYLTSSEELSTGYIFLQTLHNFHEKTVDLTRVYIKPKNEYEVLQNYKYLVNCFNKIGWKKFDPERYAKKKEKDYLSLAQTMKKILSSRNIQQSRLQSNLDVTLEEFKEENEVKQSEKVNCAVNSNIVRLQKTKKELLTKINKIHQELLTEIEGNDRQKIAILRQRISQILKGTQ